MRPSKGNSPQRRCEEVPAEYTHWHGASASSEFIQIAITGRENSATVWLEPVTDEEYAQEVR